MPELTTKPLTVSEYAARIARSLRQVGAATLEGEVRDPRTSRSGLLYFELTDGDSTLECKVFARQLDRLAHRPREGDLITARVDRPDMFQKSGRLSLIVSEIELTGAGALHRRRRQLLQRLVAEGLADAERRKRPPRFPRGVGVISGAGSKAMTDVITALQDRFPPIPVVTCPALVQGLRAPGELIDALATLQERPEVDVIILARGGGSVQDLVAFDDERVCRAVFACAKPVITAIGHTDNDPVCNQVAWAAYTPSRSAELAVPSAAELRRELEGLGHLVDRVPERLRRGREQVDALAGRFQAADPLERRRLRIQNVAAELDQARRGFFSEREQGIGLAAAALDTVPARLPGRETIDAIGSVLAPRAERALERRSDALRLNHEALERSRRRMARLSDDVAATARRIAAGIERQRLDHERDYGRALTRLGRECVEHVGRALRGRRQQLTAVDELGGDLRRHLDRAERDLEHLAQVIAAHDFRRRGWVAASDDSGRRVRSASAVYPAMGLDLRFIDGAVHARAETITTDKETQDE